jgi:two-component system phosphate regulon sensor histidine kinase PhoR
VQLRGARLEQDRQQLIVVLEAMAGPVIAVDTRHRLLFANASANQLFGLDATSVGQLVPELIRSPQVQDAVEAIRRLASPTAYQGERTLPARNGPARSPSRSPPCATTPCPAIPQRVLYSSFTT